jgi:hypothetical protein
VIRDWLDADDVARRVLMVTDAPGGKSAVLGRIVTTADPAIRERLPRDDEAVREPAPRPGMPPTSGQAITKVIVHV